MLRKYDSVFNPRFKGYNGGSGPLDAKVNMGPIQPPQRKDRVPQYSKDQLVTLTEKFDELESIGVFAQQEEIGVTVEYFNLSFLVKKPTGGFRLVTAFADVGRYSKPQLSLMPDVDSTLRQIAQWEYIIISNLTKSFTKYHCLEIPSNTASLQLHFVECESTLGVLWVYLARKRH